MVAQEWRAQEGTIRMDLMRLTGLSFTALDNPLNLIKERVVDSLIEHLQTDTLFYLAAEPEALRYVLAFVIESIKRHYRRMQQLQWGAIVQWAREEHDLDVTPSNSVMQGW